MKYLLIVFITFQLWAQEVSPIYLGLLSNVSAAELRGTTGVTSGLAIVGFKVPDRGQNTWKFNIITTGLYKLFTNTGAGFTEDTTWAGSGVDGLGNLGGNIKSGIGFPADNITLEIVNDTIQIKNDGVAWVKLAPEVRDQIIEPLWNQQNPDLHPLFQMHARYSHFIFEQFYSSDSSTMQYFYDETDSTFLTDRRNVESYIRMLVAMHRATGNDVYIRQAYNIFLQVRASGTHLVSVKSGSPIVSLAARSLDLNPDDSQWTFTQHDVNYHIAGIYLFENGFDPDSIFLNEAKNFADVLLSYMDRDSTLGWGWTYQWATGEFDKTEDRANGYAPQIYFYGYLADKNITTDFVSQALCDSILDSVFVRINQSWLSNASDQGGWKENIKNSIIGYEYTNATLWYMYATAELPRYFANPYDNISFVAGWADTLQKIVNYYSDEAPTGELKHYFFMNESWYSPQAITLAMARNRGIVTQRMNPWIVQHAIKGLLEDIYFTGFWPPWRSVTAQRRASINYNFTMSEFIQFLNTYDFQDEWIRKFETAFSLTQNSYLSDGFLLMHRNWIGTQRNYPTFHVGYRTLDITPIASADTAAAAIDINGIITIPYPIQLNGKSYTYKHKMGTNVIKVIPSVADTIDFFLEDNVNDSFWYYDVNGCFSKITQADIAINEFFKADISRGIMGGELQTVSAVRRFYLGIIANHGGIVNILKVDANRFSIQTTLDSVWMFNIDPWQSNLYKNGNSETGTDLAVKDQLRFMEHLKDNDINWQGLIKNNLDY